MNALIGNSQQYHELKVEEDIETQTIGEVLAIAFVSFMVASIFVLSGWSAVLFISGNTSDGGPIGFLFNLIRTAGVV